MTKFKVTKEISEADAWEVGAEVGDILYVCTWNSRPTLLKDGKAVCDLGSRMQIEDCEKIQQN